MSFKHQAQIMRVARFNKEFSQAQMAEHLGGKDMHPNQISNIEQGQCGIPDKYWDKLAAITGKNALFKALSNDLRDYYKAKTK